MESIPLIRRTAFQHCTSTLESLGYSADRVLARASIPSWQYGRPDEMVPFHDMLRALNAGAQSIGDQSFGLIAADRNPMKFGTFASFIARSVSLYDACRNATRLVNLLNSTSHMRVYRVPSGILICRDHPPSWQLEQYVLRHAVGLVQMAAGPHWRPREVYLCSQETYGLNDTELFADTIFHVGQPLLAVAVPESLLSASFENGSDFASDATEKMLRETAAADDFVGSVCQIIEAMLPYYHPSIATISEILGVSKRTLQRELAKEGVVYRDLVGQVRFKIARERLVESDMRLRDIAHELGYASETHFVRAFRHWAGITPGMHRALSHPR